MAVSPPGSGPQRGKAHTLPAVLNAVQILALGIWVGAMLGFGAVVAPVLFAEIASRQVAGELAGAMIAALDRWGLILGAVVLVCLLGQFCRNDRARLDSLRLALIMAMLTAALLSSVYVRGKMETVRARLDRPIEAYEQEHPLRAEHNRWHRASTRLYSATALMGTGLLVLTALRRH